MKKLFFILGEDNAQSLTDEEKNYLIGFEIKGMRFALERPGTLLDIEEAEAAKKEIEQKLPGKLMLPDIDECQLLHRNFTEVNRLLDVLGRPLLEKGDYWTSIKTSGENYLDFDMHQGGWYAESPKTKNRVVYCFI